MRKLRHPIVMFVVAVLAVIGIGVGVLATQGPPKGTYVVAGCRYINASVQTYGSQRSRLAAEFPAQPTKTLARPSGSATGTPRPGWLSLLGTRSCSAPWGPPSQPRSSLMPTRLP